MSKKSAASKNNTFIGSDNGWTAESTKELLQKMKTVIPKPDVSKYKTMLSKLDWEKIKFGKYSVKDCQDQWARVYKKLQKFKTLSDLVSESFEYIENPYKGNVKKHPDHPKRPLTPYFRFFLGEREKYAKMHKDLSNLEITNILSKKYREISVTEKDKYESEWKSEMIDYKIQLEEFKKNHPEYYDKSPPRISRTPIAIFNQEQIASMNRSKKKMSKKQLQDSLKNKYHNLDDDQKLPYIMKSIEEWEKYKEELEMYKKSHNEFVMTDRYTKSVLTISDWRIYDKNLGRPDRPPANGYNLFCTRMMVSDSMKHLSSRDRIMQCGQKWKLLTEAEKSAYQDEFLKMRDTYRTAQEDFLTSLTPRQRDEYLERKKETETKRNLKRKVPIVIKQEVPSEEESEDSDDEEMEVNDDSSSESSSSESSADEEEEQSGKKAKSPSPAAKITSPAPLRPTTPISALFLYQKSHREKFAAKHPNVSKNDITIMLARRFNNLPQEKKAKYIQKEKEQRALYNEQMRKHLLGESSKVDAPAELKPVTGEQIFQEQSRAGYLKKAGGSEEKAQEIMRKTWTQMNKERRKKYINIAHEQNAKNIAQHQAAVAASKKQNKNTAESSVPVERNLSQKEIKSYLALEPKKVPKDGLLLFKMEHRLKLNHLKPSARTQELSRLWESSSAADKNKYKEKAKTGLSEYNKKLQRWIKSLPPQALEAYKASLEKSKTKQAASKTAVSNGGAKKRKAETASTKAAKKSKKDEESDESSDDSSDDDDSSSSDSDDESDSSDSDDSSDDSSSSDEDGIPQTQLKKQESSGDSSSSDEDDSGSD